MNDLNGYLLTVALYLLSMSAFAVANAEDEVLLETGSEQVLEVAEEMRDPFWPVGYMPKEDVPEERVSAKDEGWMIEGNFSDAEKAIISSKLKLRGIMARGSKRYAVLDNRLAGVDDILHVQVGIRKVSLRVVRFNGKSVVLSPDLNSEDTAPLKENEYLLEKQPEAVKPRFRALP